MDLWSICSDVLQHVLLRHWFLVSSAITLVLLYRYYTRTFSYFKDMGVQYIEPSMFIGNLWDRVVKTKSAHEFYVDIYNHFEGLPYGGYFEGYQPKLMIRDPELIKTICIKDFNFFPNRNRDTRPAQPCNKRDLLFLRGNEWKHARSIVSPSFTSGKLKAMEGLIQQCGEQLVEFLRNRSDTDRIFEMKEFTGRYTIQNIGACAFSLDFESLKDLSSPFFKNALGLFKGSTLSHLLFLISFLFYPKLAKYTPLSESNTKGTKYFCDVVDKVRAERENQKEESRRVDFLHLLLKYAEKERLENPDNKIADDLFIHGQSIMFFAAGYETTSTLLGFACHSLAVYPEIQDRLRKDILKAYEKHGNVCSYEMINSIPYLEQVINETLRMYPPAPRIERECAATYTIPGTNITIKPGEVVSICLAGLMSDPNYFPEPWKFNPDRFGPDDTTSVKDLFVPFGIGPRNCIGLRFSLMSAKFYMCYLLKEFKLTTCSKTQYPIKFDKSASILLNSEKGNWIKIEPLVPKKT